MIKTAITFEDALRTFDRSTVRGAVKSYNEQRAEVLKGFPLGHWPQMTLEEYALGQEDSEHTFCRWMEFKTLDLGSIRGGSARKLIVYKPSVDTSGQSWTGQNRPTLARRPRPSDG